MRKVRYALIGFGGIAENRIAREGFGLDKSRFAGHPQAELVGATDRIAARRDAAARLGLKWYDSVEAVLSDPAIEAVFIATNNLSHAPLAREGDPGRQALPHRKANHDHARRRHEIAAVSHASGA